MKDTIHCHFVPRMVLRHFGDKISTYNIKEKKLEENRKLEKVYALDHYYPQEIEDLLAQKVESPFGNLLNNKILKKEGEIVLSRTELMLIKKFLAVSVLRSITEERTIEGFKHHFDKEYRKPYIEKLLRNGQIKQEQYEDILKMDIPSPIQEVVVPNEGLEEYRMRSLRVLLESSSIYHEDIVKHPQLTYFAYHWAMVMQVSYLAFWDSDFDNDEFVITDVGMTSENERGWDEDHPNHIKREYYQQLIEKHIEKDKEFANYCATAMINGNYITENFMMFPISAKRMIVIINPFFKFIKHMESLGVPKFDLSTITVLNDERLYCPNDVKYVNKQRINQPLVYDDGDRYIYKISKLTREETQYCNVLFMDRVNTWLGFSKLRKAYKSIVLYKNLHKKAIPRNDYNELFKIIEKRFFEL